MIPEDLRSRDQWLCWRYEKRAGKSTKVPVSAHGGPGDASDPAAWATYAQTTEARDQHGYDGVGFVFSAYDPFVGIDLDHVRDPDTGVLEPWAQKIVGALNSYTEVSPSGRGLHVFVKGELPAGGRRRGQLEMYDSGRFFTVSGDHLEGSPETVEERTLQLESLHRRVFGERDSTESENGHHAGGAGNSLTDQEIIARAGRAKNGEEFSRLWAGTVNGHGSHSEADLALCSMLAFWTGGDPARIDALFRQSRLMRDKWDRADYRDRTIRAAVSGARDFYSPSSKNDGKNDGKNASCDAAPEDGEPDGEPGNRLLHSRVLLGEAMELGIEPPEELEPGILLKGKSHSFYAPSGVGKSWLGLWLAKQAVERGERVLVLDLENGPRTIAERLQELGVDPAAVDENLVYLSSPHLAIPDAPDYEALLDQERPDLVLFDSHVGFLARAALEENSNTDVELWAATFLEPARVRNITTVVLDHVSHENSHARGAIRKIDVVDVSWKVHKTKPFDRERVGELTLFREKDREAFLPPSVKFSVGGGESGFIFRRSSGTTEEDDDPARRYGLTPSAEQVLGLVKKSGEQSMSWAELKRNFKSSIGSLSNARNELLKLNLIWQHEYTKRYHAIELKNRTNKPDVESSTEFNQSSTEPTEPDESREFSGVHPPCGGEPLNSDVEPSCVNSGNDLWEDRQQDIEDALSKSDRRPKM